MSGVLLSLGHGYSARALARPLLAEGWRVIGTTRSAEKAEALRAEGVEPVLWPQGPAAGELVAALEEADHVLVSAGPSPDGDPSLALLSAALSARAGALRWIGYLSTTGVYGDHGGGWVDETTTPVPATARGRARVAAEAEWLALHARLGAPVHVFRLAGIYGPGRSPFDKVRRRDAKRIVKPGQVFGRIHVEDIARVLRASIDRPNPGAIYNVTDDEPAPPQDVIGYAAELLGMAPPPEVPFEEAAETMSPMARSFYADSKRVSNDRIRRELGVALTYPGYREGLRAVLAAEANGAG